MHVGTIRAGRVAGRGPGFETFPQQGGCGGALAASAVHPRATATLGTLRSLGVRAVEAQQISGESRVQNRPGQMGGWGGVSEHSGGVGRQGQQYKHPRNTSSRRVAKAGHVGDGGAGVWASLP